MRRLRAACVLASLASVPFAIGPFAIGPLAPEAFAEAMLVQGRFVTTFAIDAEHRGRALNIELAASAIDGKVVLPGATYSFNDAVGERTAAFGYARATVLRDGMLAEGTGGGTCQVASTLHAAALLAGMDVIERAPHSRPSAYIRVGLDATVAYGTIDLKIANPTRAPMTIRARAAKGSLDVAIDAPLPPPRVTLTSEIVERVPFENVYERDRGIVDGKLHVRTFGIPGLRVRRMRVVDRAGDVRRDVRVDRYAPVNALLRTATPADAGADAPNLAVDPEATRPALVQVRPSMIVVLDNAPTGP